LQNPLKFQYLILGKGKDVLIAFHGFGQSEAASQEFSDKNPQYTVFSISLLAHGSTWEGDVLESNTAVFNNAMTDFLNQHRIDRFSVAGFSIGARAVLAMLPTFALRISEIILISPHGLTKSVIYSWATATPLGRYLFKKSLTHPFFLRSVVQLLAFFALIPRSFAGYLLKQFSDENLRQRIYNTWVIYKDFSLSQDELAVIIDTYQLKLFFFTAEKDIFFPLSSFKTLQKKVKNGHFYTIKSGHFSLLRHIPTINIFA
jgi:pimeloyl-ACP methyl ester carboxylesterase